jgi:hypothetical protein
MEETAGNLIRIIHHRDTEDTEKSAEWMTFFGSRENNIDSNFFLVFSVASVSLW